jgi:hypothetical protein
VNHNAVDEDCLLTLSNTLAHVQGSRDGKHQSRFREQLEARKPL